MSYPARDDAHYAALCAEWAAESDRQQAAYDTALSAFVTASRPFWGQGDGFGGRVMNDLTKAQLAAGFPMLRYGPWAETRAAFANRRRQLRAAVVERDGETCDACGSVEKLQIDHKVPVYAGGGNNLENLHLLCAPCKSAKGTMTWADFLAHLVAGEFVQ